MVAEQTRLMSAPVSARRMADAAQVYLASLDTPRLAATKYPFEVSLRMRRTVSLELSA